jgi:orotate phosphoribosyltransferase
MFSEASELRELRDILLRKSVRLGAVKLSSGELSDIYVDCKPTTCDPNAMPLIGRIFLQKMRDRNWAPEAVGGLIVGAEPIAFAIARESLDTPQIINAFIVRKERKPHGMQKLVEGLDPTEGRKVVIIDDVCTKGGSTALAIENAQSAGMKVIGALCLVDREQGASKLLAEKFGLDLEYVFKISDLRQEAERRANEHVLASH